MFLLVFDFTYYVLGRRRVTSVILLVLLSSFANPFFTCAMKVFSFESEFIV